MILNKVKKKKIIFYCQARTHLLLRYFASISMALLRKRATSEKLLSRDAAWAACRNMQKPQLKCHARWPEALAHTCLATLCQTAVWQHTRSQEFGKPTTNNSATSYKFS
jgi:hypothetical protein